MSYCQGCADREAEIAALEKRMREVAEEARARAQSLRGRARVIHNDMPDHKKPVSHVELEAWAAELCQWVKLLEGIDESASKKEDDD